MTWDTKTSVERRRRRRRSETLLHPSTPCPDTSSSPRQVVASSLAPRSPLLSPLDRFLLAPHFKSWPLLWPLDRLLPAPHFLAYRVAVATFATFTAVFLVRGYFFVFGCVLLCRLWWWCMQCDCDVPAKHACVPWALHPRVPQPCPC